MRNLFLFLIIFLAVTACNDLLFAGETVYCGIEPSLYLAGNFNPEKLKCFVTQLRDKEPDLQDALLQKLACLLAGTLDGNRMKQNIYDLYTQVKYTTGKV